MESDVAALEIAPQLLEGLRALIADLYIPVVESQELQRRGCEAKEEFLQVGGRAPGAAAAALGCAVSSTEPLNKDSSSFIHVLCGQ